jgi:hypothetical protein
MSDTLPETPHGYGRDFDYNRLVEFVRQEVQPPARVYVTRDDTLILRIWTPIESVTVRTSLRFQGPDGRIIPQFSTIATQSSGATPTTQVFSGAEGYLLSAVVENNGTSPTCAFISLEIIRGLGSSDQTRGQIILCGNLRAASGLSFPQTPNTSPLEGRGRIRSVLIGDPGAGVNLFTQVPTGVTWILRSVYMRFATSATVANRTPALKLADGGLSIIAEFPLTTVIAASQNTVITWAADVAPFVLPGFAATCPIPLDYRLPAGWFIITDTLNLQAADAYTLIDLVVEEFINT